MLKSMRCNVPNHSDLYLFGHYIHPEEESYSFIRILTIVSPSHAFISDYGNSLDLYGEFDAYSGSKQYAAPLKHLRLIPTKHDRLDIGGTYVYTDNSLRCRRVWVWTNGMLSSQVSWLVDVPSREAALDPTVMSFIVPNDSLSFIQFVSP